MPYKQQIDVHTSDHLHHDQQTINCNDSSLPHLPSKRTNFTDRKMSLDDLSIILPNSEVFSLNQSDKILSDAPSNEMKSKMVPSFSAPNFFSLELAHQRIIDSGLTFSEAKYQLWNLRQTGWIFKRGFHYRKLWVKRYIELNGRMLKYYAKLPEDNHNFYNARGELELNSDSLVVPLKNKNGKDVLFFVIRDKTKICHTSNSNFHQIEIFLNLIGQVLDVNNSDSIDLKKVNSEKSFSEFLNSDNFDLFIKVIDDPVWRFETETKSERDLWVNIIRKSIKLIARVELPPTLCGIGSLHFHYQIIEKISTGDFMDTYSAVATISGKPFIIRSFNKIKYLSAYRNLHMLQSEINIMGRITRELDHPNLCKLFQVYEQNSSIYLVIESLTGDYLYKHLSEYLVKLTEVDIANIARQIASALKEIHNLGIVLRNLSPENIVYANNSTGVIKIVDFSKAIIAKNLSKVKKKTSRLSRYVQSSLISQPRGNSDPLNFNFSTSFIENIDFVAPEVILNEFYSEGCDIWALGCILYTLLVGSLPFAGSSGIEKLKAIILGYRADKIKKNNWFLISSSAQDLVNDILQPNSHIRINAEQILNYSWLKYPINQNSNLAAARIKILKEMVKSKLKNSKNSGAYPYLSKNESVSSANINSETNNDGQSNSLSSNSIHYDKNNNQTSNTYKTLSRYHTITPISEDRQGYLVNQSKKFENLEDSFNLISSNNGYMSNDQRKEMFTLDVWAKKVRSTLNKGESDLFRSLKPIKIGCQADFTPAGRFLQDLEVQMMVLQDKNKF